MASEPKPIHFEGLDFTPMREEDIPALTAIMTRSFDEDSRLFSPNPTGGPDGYDDGSFLRKWGLESGARSYRIDRDEAPIGGLIVFIQPDGKSGFLGTVFIDAGLTGHGYGYTAWRFVEATFPSVRCWRTETPAVSYRNHRFYVNKCGFHIVRVDGGMDRFEAQFQLEKQMDGVK